MSVILDEVREYIGLATDWQLACDVVERGAVRRFAQATMDEDEIFWSPVSQNQRFGGPTVPHLFPTLMFRRPFGTLDPMIEHAADPDFDGTGALSTQGLPPIEPLAKFSVLNGGSEVEIFSFACLGDSVEVRSTYADITEKLTSKGYLILVIIESEYRVVGDRPLLKLSRTQIRRPEGATV